MNDEKLTTRQIKDRIRCGRDLYPGNYPIYFINSYGEALAFESVRDHWGLVGRAVRRNLNSPWLVVSCEINWESLEMFCQATGERIPCALEERDT